MAAPRKDNVFELIINTTENLILEKSTYKITISDIAKTANLSKGTIYYYFSSKEEIFMSVLDKYLNNQWEAFELWMKDTEKEHSLYKVIKYILTYDSENSGFKFNLLIEAAFGNNDLKEKLLDRYKKFSNEIHKAINDLLLKNFNIDEIEANLAINSLTWILLLLSDGLLLHQQLDNKLIDKSLIIDSFAKYCELFESRYNIPK